MAAAATPPRVPGRAGPVPSGARPRTPPSRSGSAPAWRRTSHLAAPQLTAQHRLLVLVNPVHLKDMLGGIQANPDNPHRAAPLAALQITAWHYDAVGGRPPNMNTSLWNMDSGLPAARRPGMTGRWRSCRL